jgi:hypothetical protein
VSDGERKGPDQFFGGGGLGEVHGAGIGPELAEVHPDDRNALGLDVVDRGCSSDGFCIHEEPDDALVLDGVLHLGAMLGRIPAIVVDQQLDRMAFQAAFGVHGLDPQLSALEDRFEDRSDRAGIGPHTGHTNW